jgi:long-chain acyl-CoA synthetase
MSNYVWEKSYPPGVKWELDVPKKTIHQIFEESCAQYADRPFTDFLDKVMTFRDYKEASDRAAAGFQKLASGRASMSASTCPTRRTTSSPSSACSRPAAGGELQPLDAARELEFKIGDSETDILVTLDVTALYPKMAAMRGKTRLKKLIVGSIADYLPWPKNWLYPIAKKKDSRLAARRLAHVVQGPAANDGKYTSHPRGENLWDEVALLQYTGGTTGLPKAAMLTHGCVVSAMAQGQAWTTPYTTPGTEKVVCVLPLFHIYALSGIMLGAVRNGNQLILYPRPDIDMIVDDLGKKKPTFLPGVPTLYTAINKHPKAQGSTSVAQDLHVGRRAAAGRGAAELREADRRHPDRGLRPDRDLADRRDLPGRQERAPRRLVRRADAGHDHRDPRHGEQDTVLPAGKEHVGEVCIIGPQVMKGYWKKHEETDKVLFSHPAATGRACAPATWATWTTTAGSTWSTAPRT